MAGIWQQLTSVILTVGLAVWLPNRSGQERTTQEFIEQYEVPPIGNALDGVRARIRWELRTMALILAVMAGSLGVCAGLGLEQTPGLTMAQLVLGLAIWRLMTIRPLMASLAPLEARRSARVSDVSVGDYAPITLRWVALALTAVLAVTATGVGLLTDPTPWELVLPAGAAAACGLASELLMRHVVAQPEPSADDAELYAQDALRARCVFGTYAVHVMNSAVLLFVLAVTPGGAPWGAVMALVTPALLLYVAWLYLSRAFLQFRARLWGAGVPAGAA